MIWGFTAYAHGQLSIIQEKKFNLPFAVTKLEPRAVNTRRPTNMAAEEWLKIPLILYRSDL